MKTLTGTLAAFTAAIALSVATPVLAQGESNLPTAGDVAVTFDSGQISEATRIELVELEGNSPAHDFRAEERAGGPVTEVFKDQIEGNVHLSAALSREGFDWIDVVALYWSNDGVLWVYVNADDEEEEEEEEVPEGPTPV